MASTPSDQPIFNYSTAPYVSGSETSFDAGEAIKPNINRLCRIVLDAIEASPEGLTCDQTEVITGISHQTCSPRFKALKDCTPQEIIPRRLPDGSIDKRKTRSGRKAVVYVRNQEVA